MIELFKSTSFDDEVLLVAENEDEDDAEEDSD